MKNVCKRDKVSKGVLRKWKGQITDNGGHGKGQRLKHKVVTVACKGVTEGVGADAQHDETEHQSKSCSLMSGAYF